MEMTAAKLDELYRNASQVDDKIFSEMRSNILLVSGDHYAKQGSRFWNRIRSTKELNDTQRLRLTKNHVANICDIYEGNIIGGTANTTPIPNNEDEIQDQKTAELNKSVWEYEKKRLKFRSKVRDFASHFIQLGEVYAKVFFDPELGEIIGYEPKLEDDGETPMLSEEGEQQADEAKPIFQGLLDIEEIYAFNLLRCPSVQDMHKSPYLIVRKMVDRSVIKEMVGSEKYKELIDENEETYTVFDGDKAGYEESKSQIMLREHYYRPCREYPNGYFYIATSGHILNEGELPYGVWPIAGAGFNKVPTTPRYRSPIKRMRPYQIEINRSASAIATAQVTLGDDKLILPNGSKISAAGTLPGVRAISVNGAMDPKVLAGRSGDQYVGYMQGQITELYQVMNANEDDAVREGQLDPYALLYHSARNKKKFRKYSEAFEEFVSEITEIHLDLARHYYDDNHTIPMVGRSEQVNMAEFKHSEKNCYRIQIENVSDDVDTMLGKQLAINHTLQYVGGQLDKRDIGKMMRAMPFMNYEEAYGDMAIDYDMSKNDMLAMERGEMPMLSPHDDHIYLIQRAVHRMKKPDYRFLPPQVQQAYQMYVQQHQQVEAQKAAELQRAQAGFIPATGPMVTVDYYTTDEEGKTKRAKFPFSAVQWLEKQLQTQGTSLSQLESLDQGSQAQIAQLMQSQQQAPMPQL